MKNIPHNINSNTLHLSQRIALGDEIKSKCIIYLDQKYWNILRDVKYGQRNNSFEIKLYKIILELVRDRKVVCPISYSVFCETMRQNDKKSRMRTAQTIDELCGGITIHPPTDLDYMELSCFLKNSVGIGGVNHPTKIAYNYVFHFLGEAVPYLKHVSPELNTYLQNEFYEFTSKILFSEIIDQLPDLPNEFQSDDTLFQEKLTEESKNHSDEFKSFKQAFLNEIGGMVDLFRSQLSEIMIEILKENHNVDINDSYRDELNNGTIKPLENLIYLAFSLNKIKDELPCLHIPASIYAAKRYRQDYFKKGDSHDALHARVALPYSDVFLTEKNLGNLITTNPLSLDKIYSCSIAWSAEQAIKILEYKFPNA